MHLQTRLAVDSSQQPQVLATAAVLLPRRHVQRVARRLLLLDILIGHLLVMVISLLLL